MPAISKRAILGSLPPESSGRPVASSVKVVVLDDDPTGTQTVHGIPVLTEWGVDILAEELGRAEPCFYVLTNSRAVSSDRACEINRQVGANLAAAAERTGRQFRVVSRSDSTLRGHFPAETDALAEGLRASWDATLVIPAFFAGGRFTIGDVHYVAAGDTLTPAGETEFARDAEFGYRKSNLREWVEEKTGGRVRAADVVSISLEDARSGGAPAVRARLESVPRGGVAIVNAAAPSDLAVLTQALAELEQRGRRYLFRTAADFVPVYAGIVPRALLQPNELRAKGSKAGGLVIAGSYVGRTSEQLELLFASTTSLERVEIDVSRVLDRELRFPEIERAAKTAAAALAAGRDVVLYTSRQKFAARTAEEFGAAGRDISAAVVEIVRCLPESPRWLVAKGGITSSDIATKALGIRRAIVLGQALPGVPVWASGPESKWPGLPYVVFPGNVGQADSLAQLVGQLRGSS